MTGILETANGLTSLHRPTKLSALNDLLRNAPAEVPSKKQVDMEEFRLETLHNVVLLFVDSSESVRQKALEVYSFLLEEEWQIAGSLPTLLNLFSLQLGNGENRETSEEIRLTEVKLLKLICERKVDTTKVYLDDILRILDNCLKDSYAEVRQSACECLEITLLHVKSDFFSKSDHIINTLLATFTHNQAKVRAANTEAIGYALLYGNYKRISDVWRSLAQRVIDSHHLVRRTVLKVLHLWMTQLPDRYSHWNRFIPLFVCGLFDEISDIQRETSAMWINIGEQYGSENREELKDASTYDDLIESYPEATERPTLGCRVLVKKVIFNVLQSNLNDLKDWQIRVRIQGIKLLYQLILHAERHVIILADKMLSALPQVAKDESQDVVVEAKKCAALLGCFLPPKVYCELLVKNMDSASHLVILSGILSGVSKLPDPEYLNLILKTMLVISHTKLPAQHFYNLECCGHLLRMWTTDLEPFVLELYQLLTQIAALTSEAHLKEEVQRYLSILANRMNMASAELLHKKLSRSFLEKILRTGGKCVEWSSCSLEYDIFRHFILEAGLYVFLQNFDLLANALLLNLSEAKPVKVRFHLYQLMIDVIQGGTTVDRSVQLNTKYIKLLFLPNLTWRGGRAESVIRATCSACLAVMLEREVFPMSAVVELKSELLPRLIGLTREENRITLHAALYLICTFVRYDASLESRDLKEIYPALLTGLDGEDRNRIIALRGIKEMFRRLNFGKGDTESLKVYVEEVCRVLMVHMGDSNKDVAGGALECLKLAVSVASPCVQHLAMAESQRADAETCGLLEDYLNKLRVSAASK